MWIRCKTCGEPRKAENALISTEAGNYFDNPPHFACGARGYQHTPDEDAYDAQPEPDEDDA